MTRDFITTIDFYLRWDKNRWKGTHILSILEIIVEKGGESRAYCRRIVGAFMWDGEVFLSNVVLWSRYLKIQKCWEICYVAPL